MAYVQVSGKIYDTCPSDGKVLIDEKFVHVVSEHYLSWNPQGYVLIRSYGTVRKIKYLHDYLYELHTGKRIPSDKELHHKYDNKWDDRMDNLELTTCAHNNASKNQKTDSSTSKYKGVCFISHKNKWKSDIRVNGKKVFLGYFDDEFDAAKAYDKAFLAVHGSITGNNGLLEPDEIQHIQKHRNQYIPCPKRETRELPKYIKRSHNGYEVHIRKQDLQFRKRFVLLKDAIICINNVMKKYNDEKEATWLKTPIERDDEGIAIVKVKKPNVDEYVNARVDDEDWHNVARYTWRLWNGYAVSTELGMMHTYIQPNSDKTKVVDHIDNKKKLDNRKVNLRVVSPSINARNRSKRKDCSSTYTGVHKNNKRWRANISNLGVRTHLGYFDTEEDAHDAYKQARMNIEAQDIAGLLN